MCEAEFPATVPQVFIFFPIHLITDCEDVWHTVLRIRDVYPGTEFFRHGSWIQGQKDSGFRIRINDFKCF
jgi:hypothetical protein